ncbi:phage tail tape measure protein [Halodesulfovibrio sp. MK-HDV]|uniref:phage tail tape measure protein n=1 Tax=Halodesulfovibrio sp. MK-HDV TaxID=2599925 RepID=UPI0013682471|nr:phage tail tape measure protein [Halodesulfovibrio sp. MK-HDV]
MEIFEVFATFSLLDNLSGPLNRIRQSFRSTDVEGGRLSSMMGGLTKRLLPLALAAGIVLGAFAPTIGVAMEFEAVLSGLGAISNASAADMNVMEQSALDLGASTAFSAAQVVEAQTELAKKGFTANQVVGSMPGLLDLAAAAQTSLANAAGVTSGALNSFHMEAAQAAEVADIIAAASTTSATDVDGLGMALQNAGAVVAGVGGDFALLAAITGKLADANINASVAGTATKIMFNRLAAPTGDAAKALSGLGVVTRDAQGNMLPFLDIMGSLETAMQGKGTAEQAELLKRVFGEEAVGSVTALLGQGVNSLREYHDTLSNSTGTASAMAAKQLDNLKGSLTILDSGVEGLSISVGSVFTPALKVLVDAVTGVVGWLNALASHPVGKAILALVGGVAAVTLAVTLFSAASWAATAAVGAMNLMILANPIVLVAAALVAGAILIMTYWDNIKNFFVSLWEPVAAFADEVEYAWNRIAGAFHMDGLTGAVEAVLGLFDIDLSDSGRKLLASFVDGIRLMFTPLRVLVSSVGHIFDFLQGDISLFEAGKRILGSLVDGVKSMATAPFEAVKSALTSVRNLLPFSDAKEGPLSALTLNGQKVMDTIGEGVTKAAPDLHGVVNNALAGIETPDLVMSTVAGVVPEVLEEGVKLPVLQQESDAGIMQQAVPDLAAVEVSKNTTIETISNVVEQPVGGGVTLPEIPTFPETKLAQEVVVPVQQPEPDRPKRAKEQQLPRPQEHSPGGVVIQNLTVSLPDVSNAQDFVSALQQLVSEFDGQAPQGAF